MCTTCGCNETATLDIEQNILAENDNYAAANRHYFQQHQILCLNVVASPGAGKTSLLSATGQLLAPQMQSSVIVGDQQTDHDAKIYQQHQIPALQIATEKVCHLDAHMIHHAIETIAPQDKSLLMVENVGNLVCPALFDLGEDYRIAILSVTEGEDKPVKYPYLFRSADLIIISKTDLLPHLRFDMDLCLDYIKQVNPKAEVIQLSLFTEDNMEQWTDWLKQRYTNKVAQ